MTGRPVLVCGLPSSGNRLVVRILQAAAVEGGFDRNAAGDAFVAVHGTPGATDLAKIADRVTARYGKPVVLVPVRAVVPWRAAVEARWPNLGYGPAREAGSWNAYRTASRRLLFDVAARRGLDVLLISYEGLTSNPADTVADFCAFAGWRAPTTYENIYDGNARRLGTAGLDLRPTL